MPRTNSPLKVLLLVLAACLVFQSCREPKKAREIVNASGITGGLIIHVGCGDGKLTAALRLSDAYTVQGLDRNPEKVRRAREHIKSKQLYGHVSVGQLKGNVLPYISNLVNLVVGEDVGDISPDEVMRVLRPGGVAYVRKGSTWEKRVKPRPEALDDWTHYLYDASGNPVSRDTAVGPPRRLQWVGDPRWSRHHDRMSSINALVSAGGRIFYIVDEAPAASVMLPASWFLVARDAFNGKILWKQPIEEWQDHLWTHKSGPASLPRRLVASGEKVYVTLGIRAPVSVLDAATGEPVKAYPETAGTEEFIISDDVLFVTVRPDSTRWGAWSPTRHDWPEVLRRRPFDEKPETIMAVNTQSGEVLWRKTSRHMPLTMAVDEERLFFNDGEKVVCLDRESGNELWTSVPLPRWKTILPFFGPTLVVQKGVVLYAGGENMRFHHHGRDKMTALSAETGEVLWQAEHPPSGYQSPEDILIVNGIVWTPANAQSRNRGVLTGRNILTGEVVKECPADVPIHFVHHRCHPAKATDKYLLTSSTGIECIDTKRETWDSSNWVRGACLYGIMPANGLIYAPPHPCACYAEGKLNGFNALAPALPESARAGISGGQLERGPAYSGSQSKSLSQASSEHDWPTYRHNRMRSGFSKTSVPADLQPKWQTPLGGEVSSLVIAEGRAFAAKVNAHTLYALDAESGAIQWDFVAGGRIDSPPTVDKGRVLFGSADGWVYCLRADDGTLIWRFRGGPEDKRLIAREQVESVWPIHGNVLVIDDTAYFVAGRSMFLDGGMRLCRINVVTGETLSETVLDDTDPANGKSLQERIQGLEMPVALPDILSSDGKYVYMRSQVFDLEGKRLEIGPHTGNTRIQASIQKGETRHLFAPFGFTDDTWFHRAYWIYGRSMASGAIGYYQPPLYTPTGRIVSHDDEAVYGFRRKNQYLTWVTPMEYHLYSTDKDTVVEVVPWQTSDGKGISPHDYHKFVKEFPYRWSNSVPLLVRAMAIADKTLFIAGPPDVVDEEDAVKRIQHGDAHAGLAEQRQAVEGRKGGVLWAVSKTDGRKLAEHQLNVLPIFDGLAVSQGRLFFTAEDGSVHCYGG